MPIFITQGLYTREVIKGMIVKPADHADAFLRQDIEKWAHVVKVSGAKIQ